MPSTLRTLKRTGLLRASGLALALAVVACGGGGGDASTVAQDTTPPPPPITSPSVATARVDTFAVGLSFPWSLAFLPDSTMLVTERGGALKRLAANGAVLGSVSGLPTVSFVGQGGLLDIALAADFASSRRVYLSYAEADTSGRGLAVGSGVLSADGSALTQWRVVFRQLPKVNNDNHFGGRLAAASDGTLFITAGDRELDSERPKVQDLSQGNGKVFRVQPDGGAPADNPFVSTAGAQPQIWSYGHRNPQGATLRPGTDQLWINEHGPQGGDEVNRIVPGKNYGWPRVSYGCEYGTPIGACTPVGGASSGAGYQPPITYWVPTSIAPSGMAFYTGDRFPEWRGNLFVGALAGRALWRIVLNGDDTVQGREILFASEGERIRDVRQSPDGELYLLTDGVNGRVLRVAR